MKEDVPKTANVLGGRFVLPIKNSTTKDEIYKTRYVVQGHTDVEKNTIVHNSPNLGPGSMRVIVSAAAIFRFHLWSKMFLAPTYGVPRNSWGKHTSVAREVNKEVQSGTTEEKLNGLL